MATVESVFAQIKISEKAISDLRLHHIPKAALERAAEAGKTVTDIVNAGVAHHQRRIAALNGQLSQIEALWNYKFAIGQRVVFKGQTEPGTIRTRRFGDYKVTWDDGQYNEDTFKQDELEALKKTAE